MAAGNQAKGLEFGVEHVSRPSNGFRVVLSACPRLFEIESIDDDSDAMCAVALDGDTPDLFQVGVVGVRASEYVAGHREPRK
ncbi:hypothetical protein [Pandoraea horticolens]|uniref:hypothetical protein n=1 Tax=Pandoraea horticolens TaxID=2508298 RepID=UPI001242A029|nr:hypothetical protein [Pandoraea horticolens]